MLAARLQAIGGARTFTLQDSQHCRLLLTARYFSSCPSDSILRYSLDGHPALQSTASSGSSSALAVSSFRLRARLDVCIPSAFSGQRGITPACWIWRPSFERQRDFNPPEQRAAQHALWVHKTAQHPSRRLWSPLAIGTSHGKEEMRSSLRFLDNPLGSVPRATRLRRPQHDLAITVAAGCCLPPGVKASASQ